MVTLDCVSVQVIHRTGATSHLQDNGPGKHFLQMDPKHCLELLSSKDKTTQTDSSYDVTSFGRHKKILALNLTVIYNT